MGPTASTAAPQHTLDPGGYSALVAVHMGMCLCVMLSRYVVGGGRMLLQCAAWQSSRSSNS
jgi:hypothetical protein